MDQIYWHDGILQKILIEGGGSIFIDCDLYPSDDVNVRARYIFECSSALSISSTVDFSALLDNKRSGNINNGRIATPRRGVANLKLFLTDGYIEINAKKIHVAR